MRRFPLRAGVLLLAVAALAVACIVRPAALIPSAPLAEPTPTYRLPAGTRPVRARAWLTIDPAIPTFTGRIEHDVVLDAPARTLWLHARDLTVRSATVRTSARTIVATPRAGSHGRLALDLTEAAPAGAVTIDLAYEGRLSRDEALGLFREQVGDDWYVFSQFQPIDARRAFPCFDEPGHKIPWRLTARVPRANVVVSNTPAARAEEADGWRTVEFLETAPLPSYLVALAVGPFDVVDAGRASNPAGTPVRIVVPRGESADAGYAASVTGRLLGRLEAYFGIPFPYDKLDVVAIPHFSGAMENAGLIAMAQGLVLARGPAQTPGFERTATIILAHEVGHQWYGNLVTMRWWDDLWLNESFASWLELRALEGWRARWAVGGAPVDDRDTALQADRLASARRVREPVEGDDGVADAFDAITYQKGASVLRMFEAWLGRETFRRGVQRYLLDHAHGSADGGDFLAALGDAARADVGAAMSTFLDQSGAPLVTVGLRCGVGAPRVKLAQARFAPVGSRAEPRTWRVPVCVRWSGRTSGTGRACTLLEDEGDDLVLPSARCPDWVVANAGGAGYYRVRYESDLLARLLASGAGVTRLERLALLDDAVALTRAGRLPARVLLPRLGELAADADPAVVRRAVALAAVVRAWVAPAHAARWSRLVVGAFGARARALGWRARAGEDDEARQLRDELLPLLADDGHHRALTAEAVGLARAWLARQSALPADSVGSVLAAAARNGDRELFETTRRAFVSARDRAEREALGAMLLAFGDADLVRDAFDLLLGDTVDPREAAVLLVRRAATPDPSGAAWRALATRLDAFDRRVPDEFKPRVYWLAGGLCDEVAAAEVEAALSARAERTPGGRRALMQVVETIRLCAAAASAQRADLDAVLARAR